MANFPGIIFKDVINPVQNQKIAKLISTPPRYLFPSDVKYQDVFQPGTTDVKILKLKSSGRQIPE